MNVYVRELVLVAGPGRRGLRRVHPPLGRRPARRGRRRARLPGRARGAGPVDLPKEELPEVVDAFTDGVRDHLPAPAGDVDAIHANYWLSGVAGHRLKHELDLPLVSTFHTLARVKAETGDAEPERRVEAEAEVIGCSDAILAIVRGRGRRSSSASTAPTRPASRSCRRASTTPSSRPATAAAPGPPSATSAGHGPVLLFVGRIQPLKGLDVAVRALAALDDPTAVLVVVGGPAGPTASAELGPGRRRWSAELGLADRVRFVPPAAPPPAVDLLPGRRRVLVPSRSESFGLVALEAAACGTPVVAAAVGGLRTLVDARPHRLPGRGPRPGRASPPTSTRSSTTRRWPTRMAAAAAARARGYTGRPRRPACAASTPTSPPAPWSTCGD